MRISRHIMTLNKRFAMVLCFVISCTAIYIFESQISELKTSYKEIENHLLTRNVERGAFESLPVSDHELPDNVLQETIIVYNRIPKTGSTTFTNQVYDLTRRNKFYVLHVNTSKNSLKMSVFDQFNFVKNVTTWDKKPAFYHGHFAFIPFTQFGTSEALYINMLREPLDRLVSHYYFMRYGDDYRKGLRRPKQGDTTTFDECVAKQGHDCQPRELWLQIPLLCGHTAECWKVGSQWALDQAKMNLLTKYVTVGLMEQMEEFIVVLESAFPDMLTGLTEKFRSGKKSHLRKTIHKDPPSEETIKSLKKSKIYRMEKDLYDFAQKQFEFVKRYSTFVDDNGLLQPIKEKKFRYEKLFGPNGRMRE